MGLPLLEFLRGFCAATLKAERTSMSSDMSRSIPVLTILVSGLERSSKSAAPPRLIAGDVCRLVREIVLVNRRSTII